MVNVPAEFDTKRMESIPILKRTMLQQVHALYDANRAIYDALPLIKEKVQASDIKEFIDLEIEEKLRQRHRIEMIFSILKVDNEGESDDILQHIALTQRRLIERCLKREVPLSIIIIHIRSVIACQINGFQTAVSCAVGIGYPDIARLLKRALHEEKATEKRLGLLEETHLSENSLEQGI